MADRHDASRPSVPPSHVRAELAAQPTIQRPKGLFRWLSDLISPSWEKEFVKRFEKSFCKGDTTKHPIMAGETLNESISAAYGESKDILLFIHSPDNVHSDSFCRNVITDQNVIDVIQDKLCFFMGSTRLPELLSIFLRGRKRSFYPFAAILHTMSSSTFNLGALASKKDISSPQSFLSWLDVAVRMLPNETEADMLAREAGVAVPDTHSSIVASAAVELDQKEQAIDEDGLLGEDEKDEIASTTSGTRSVSTSSSSSAPKRSAISGRFHPRMESKPEREESSSSEVHFTGKKSTILGSQSASVAIVKDEPSMESSSEDLYDSFPLFNWQEALKSAKEKALLENSGSKVVVRIKMRYPDASSEEIKVLGTLKAKTLFYYVSEKLHVPVSKIDIVVGTLPRRSLEYNEMNLFENGIVGAVLLIVSTK
ncbi:hypothetical protein ADUPG1_010163 [Aduncisulcus paluster]|uniref:UAS domain-containing protein n=1 Tax=Aduncisulcus paluster TaxID=2918883 RepID=A0ABQ5L0M9_9EUKA|nr:hypothetical protein ADUPG1_010163 [Aduncisulcus paluster]